jgi:hypothetical protein
MEQSRLIACFDLFYPPHAFFIFAYAAVADDVTRNAVMAVSAVKQKVSVRVDRLHAVALDFNSDYSFG